MESKCNECNRTVPDGTYLHPLVTSEGTVAPVCAPCALRLSNEFAGVERDKFEGTQAEELRIKTLEHYEKTKQLDN